MSTKTYEQRVARLVQEATGVAYSTCLRWVSEHEAAHPERMPKDARALAIVEAKQPDGEEAAHKKMVERGPRCAACGSQERADCSVRFFVDDPAEPVVADILSRQDGKVCARCGHALVVR